MNKPIELRSWSITRSCRALPAVTVLLFVWTALAQAPAATAPGADDAVDPSRAEIRGTVVDQAGAPVAMASVSVVSSPRYGAHGSAETVEDGSFRLRLASPTVQYARLLVRTSDGALQSFVEFDESHAAQAQVRVILKPCRHISFEVVDARGEPVAGAEVGVFAHYTPITAATTGADGTATFDVPSDAAVDWVYALKPAAGFAYFENYHAFPTWGRPIPPATIRLTLAGARSGVDVRVVDAQNQPVAGVRLTPWTIKLPDRISYINLSGWGAGETTSTVTDSTGVAHFDWMPPEIEGAVTFLPYHADYHCPAPPHLLAEAPDGVLTARVFRNGRIAGCVVHSDGRPAAGVLLQAEGRGQSNHYFRGLVRTDSDGRYELSVYADQTYVVAVIDDDWAASSHVGVPIGEGERREGLDFTLGPGTVIRGTATVGPDRKAAAGETVTLIQQAGAPIGGALTSHSVDLVRWAKTDADGNYHIRVGPGAYSLRLPNGGEQETLVIKAEPEFVRDAHAPRRARGELRGRVIGPDERPVVNARVSGESIGAPGHAGFNTVTDEEGRFTTERWRDGMVVYARSADGGQAGFVGIEADDEETQVALTPAGSVSGHVVDIDGRPLTGVRVSCSLNIAGATIHLNERTDAAGGYEFGGLAVGTACNLGAYYGSNFDFTRGPALTIQEAVRVEVGDMRVNARRGE
jgi:protocatechuate 3,4-dioxygenase beta subunit